MTMKYDIVLISLVLSYPSFKVELDAEYDVSELSKRNRCFFYCKFIFSENVEGPKFCQVFKNYIIFDTL